MNHPISSSLWAMAAHLYLFSLPGLVCPPLLRQAAPVRGRRRHWHQRFFVAALLLFQGSFFAPAANAQTCGVDIYIANDQSGSIDAVENRQSRDFIRKFSQWIQLGNTNTESRVALANWSNTWGRYSFASVGENYTTQQSDLLEYYTRGGERKGVLMLQWLSEEPTPPSAKHLWLGAMCVS
jgi:acylphosphatase